ncbi:MAG: nucleoside deaminase [Acidobacteriota bacterium]
MTVDLHHEAFQRLALVEARKNPHAPFGCVIVDPQRGEVVARGFNRSRASRLLHGEIDALLDLEPPDGAAPRLVLYTTAEPCPMCAGACYFAGIDQIVYGVSIPELQRFGFDQLELRCHEVTGSGSRPVTIVGGVLHDECLALFDTARALRARRVD